MKSPQQLFNVVQNFLYKHCYEYRDIPISGSGGMYHCKVCGGTGLCRIDVEHTLMCDKARANKALQLLMSTY